MGRVKFVTTPDNDLVKEIKKEIDNYEISLQVIQAFISLITWDDDNDDVYPNSFHSIGRSMSPINGNNFQSADITPDIVLQKEDIGYVVEVKVSIPKNDDYWDNIVKQIEKYSKPLIGWWTKNERINDHCTTLLIDISYAYEFKIYLENNGVHFDNNFSIVEFTKKNGINEFIFLRKYHGEILKNDLDQYLSKGSNMPIEEIIGSYGELKFYDARPNVIEYMMSVLWQNIFNPKKSEEGVFNEKFSRWEFSVSIDELTEELQKVYGKISMNDRDKSFPKTSWVKEALDSFVEIGFAEETESKNFIIFFKKIKGDVVEEFIKRVRKSVKRSKNEGEQLSLFSEN